MNKNDSANKSSEKFIITDEKLITLFTYAYEMSRNISYAYGGKIGAGGCELSDTYRSVINSLRDNQNICEELLDIYEDFFNEFIAPCIPTSIDSLDDKEKAAKTALLQYTSELYYYFKQTKHFNNRNITIDNIDDKKDYIMKILKLSVEEFNTKFLEMFNDKIPFSTEEDEKLFRTEFDMDLKSFYHNAALIMSGASLPSQSDNKLMESTYNQMKSLIEEYEKDKNINYDGFLFGSYDDSSKKKTKKP